MTDNGPNAGAPADKKTSLPKRFYKNVAVAEEGDGFGLTLDGKPVRTPGKALLSVPSKALAEAIAEEWRRQGAYIDPRTMPLTRLANSAIDGVVEKTGAVVDDILAHARADLLCYRAGEPEKLLAEQAKHWDPVIAWARDSLHAQLNLAEGVVHIAQPDESIAALKQQLDKLDPFGLAALHVMTTLTGSALLALAVALKWLSPDEAWDAAHVDEDFQISQWGEDAEAKAHREARKADFDAAARAFELSARE